MPGHDGTGPTGMGARTGRAAGTCAGVGGSEPAGRGWGQGSGIGRGRGRGGRGWRWMFRATGLTGGQRAQIGWPGINAATVPAPSEEQELAALKRQAASLEQALRELNARIGGLEKPASAAGASPDKDTR